MKKKILFLFIISLMLLLTSCYFETGGVNVKLNTPIVELTEDLASWDEIEDALRYEVCLNDEFFYIDLTSYKLHENDQLKVRAIGDNVNFTDSDWSNEVVYKTNSDDGNDNNNNDNSDDNNNDNNNDNLTLGQKIEKEYQDLINGLTTVHTTWEFEATVVDMTATAYNSQYGNYSVKMIVEVDDILIGIYNGYVNGTYPTDIKGLEIGTLVKVSGTISEKYTLTSGKYTADIEFGNPNISWEYEGDIVDPNPISGNNVNFLMINDTHGAFTDSSSGYSIGRFGSLVEELEKKQDYILIHNGDAFQGSYVSGSKYGLPLIDAFNTIGFDCFVIGNHEFDWGIDKIAAYADGDLSNGEANFPFLGANIYYKNTTKTPNWIDPYTVVEYGDLKVGIIGVIGETQESSILTRYVADYEFVNPVNIVKEHAKTLRTTLDCDVVVVATHDYSDELSASFANLSGDSMVDAIFCAHTHQYINESVRRSDNNYIPVVQNNHKNNTASEVIINLDDNGNYDGYKTTFYYPSSYQISSKVQVVIDKYQYLINEASEVIGTTSSSIKKSTLGSYATDAMLTWDYSAYNIGGDIDLAIINTGGIRATIDSGNITRADVFEVFPFNNMVVLVNMRGKDIKSLCNKNGSYFYMDVRNGLSSYQNFEDNTIYQIAVIDYVFEGTYYTEFKNLSKDAYIETNIILRDQLIDYIDQKY